MADVQRLMLGRVGVGGAVLLLSGAAFAYDAREIRSEFVANRSINVATQYDKAWSVSNSGDGVRVGKNFVMKAPGGRVAAAELASVLSKGRVLALAAGALSGVGTVAAVGMLAYELYDQLRVRPVDGGLLGFDVGTAPLIEGAFAWKNGGGGNTAADYPFSDVSEGLGGVNCTGTQCVTSVVTSVSLGVLGTYHIGGVTVDARAATVHLSYSCTVIQTGANCGSGNFEQQRSGVKILSVPVCPAVGQLAAGLPVGLDGKCRTGEYTTAVTADEAATMAAAHEAAMANFPNLDLLAREAFEIVPLPVANPTEAELEVASVQPAHIDGPTTEEVFTDEFGQVRNTTTAVGWDFSRDPLRKNEAKWATTTTTTVRDAAGNVISTKTTTDTPADGVGAAADDAADQCAKNPDSAGCARLGEPVDGLLPKSVEPIAYAPVPFAAGGCPAAVPLNVFGAGYTVEFAPMCDAASGWIRGVVLVIGAAMAGFIFVGGLKS